MCFCVVSSCVCSFMFVSSLYLQQSAHLQAAFSSVFFTAVSIAIAFLLALRLASLQCFDFLQYSDTVGWATGKASSL